MSAQVFVLTFDIPGTSTQPRYSILVQDPDGALTCKEIAEKIKTAEASATGMWLVPTKATSSDGSAIGDVVYVKNVVSVIGPA